MRQLFIKNPATYRGIHDDINTIDAAKHHLTMAEIGGYFVNGILNLTDGTYLHGFHISDIKNGNLVIGPYPLYEIDVAEISKRGCTAVVNLQTHAESDQRQVDRQLIKNAYRKYHINHVFDMPIDYDNAPEYVRGTMEAAKKLYYLINDMKMKVYLYDTSSATRAPNVAIVYMCIYMKH